MRNFQINYIWISKIAKMFYNKIVILITIVQCLMNLKCSLMTHMTLCINVHKCMYIVLYKHMNIFMVLHLDKK